MVSMKDKGILLQIVKRCNRITDKISVITQEDFNKNEDVKEVICFNLFQIGELANGLSEEFVKEYNGIPWKQIIGMNHSNFHAKGYANSSSTVAKPARDLNEGSEYLKWLDDYETTWYNIAKEFPEIMYWEIDNESNSDTFFEKLTGGTFSLKEKADIYTDMLFFASRGIHRANPEANTIMGGLVISTAESFLQYIYDNIFADDSWSQYPDDYFQIAAWHPYMSAFTPTKLRKTN